MLVRLRQTINPDVVINISGQDKTLVIKEDARDSKIKKLIISGMPESSFAFSLDYQPGGKENKFFKQLSCYVNVACDLGVNTGCDSVIVTDLGDCNYDVLVLDLKSDKPDKKKTEVQLANSELYVKYIMSMLECHCNIDISNVTYRRAIVTTDSRGVRKNPIYRPSKAPASSTSYKIRSVNVNRAKLGTVHYGSL